jgi:hypothetical protein
MPVPTSVDPPPPHAVNINMDRDKIIQALNFNQKNSSQLCCGVRNEEGVGLEGETVCPLPIQNGFLNPFDTS